MNAKVQGKINHDFHAKPNQNKRPDQISLRHRSQNCRKNSILLENLAQNYVVLKIAPKKISE